MQYTTHKIGDTYSRARLYALGAGVWTAASSVYGPGGVLVQALSCTLSALPAPDAAGNTHALAVLATPAQTALWPAGALISDVVFTDASGATPVVQSAEPYVIRSGRYAGATDSDNPLAVLPAELATVLRGADGLSAYQLAVAGGFVGTEAQWHASLVGPAGATSWEALTGKPTFGDAAGKNTGTVAGTVAAGDHGHTAGQVGAIPTGGLKTVNGNALEGSGNISVTASPAGTTGQMQFNNAGAFAGVPGSAVNGSSLTLSGGIYSAAVGPVAGGASIGISYVGQPIVGIARNGIVGGLDLFDGSFAGFNYSSGRVLLSSGMLFGWSVTTVTQGMDTGLARNASGVVEINTGTPGVFGGLKLRNLIATGRIDLPQYTTATLPAVVNGAMIFNSDTDKAIIGGASAWEVVASV